jgi:hypothetical protein
MGLHDFDDENMQTHALGVSPYGYSATKLTKLGSPEYTLATLVVDDSGSVGSFRKGLEKLIATIVQTLRDNPRADYLMVRVVGFGSQLNEIHGFKLLSDINLQDYDNCLGDDGGTYLFGTCKNALDAMYDYAKQLTDNDFKVNGLFYAITDGDDNQSQRHNIAATDVKTARQRFKQKEVMESLVSILVGVNVQASNIKTYLEDFSKAAEFDHFLSMDDASDSTLKRIAGFGSQSISLQSQALNSGGPSQAIQSLTI